MMAGYLLSFWTFCVKSTCLLFLRWHLAKVYALISSIERVDQYLATLAGQADEDQPTESQETKNVTQLSSGTEVSDAKCDVRETTVTQTISPANMHPVTWETVQKRNVETSPSNVRTYTVVQGARQIVAPTEFFPPIQTKEIRTVVPYYVPDSTSTASSVLTYRP